MKTFINPSHIWPYREFDRNVTPAPEFFGRINHSIDEIAEYVNENGMEPIELIIIDNEKMLVTNGNHRLAASIKLGLKLVPIEVDHMTGEEADSILYPHSLSRFKSL